jgi:hypothetical protein
VNGKLSIFEEMHLNQRLIIDKGLWLILMMIFFFSGVACGRKAVPLPPKAIEPPVLGTIKGSQSDGKLRLSWPIPEKIETEALAGFYVYRSKEKLNDLPCSQCPDRFDKVADIPYDSVSLMLEKHAVYSEILEKGYQYKYRVTSYSAYGDEGPPSGEVTVDY